MQWTAIRLVRLPFALAAGPIAAVVYALMFVFRPTQAAEAWSWSAILGWLWPAKVAR